MKFSDLQDRVRELESQLQEQAASMAGLEALRADNARLREERSALLDKRDHLEFRLCRVYDLLADNGQERSIEQIAADTVAQLRAAEERARQAQMQLRNKRQQDDRHAWRRYFAALVASGLVLQQSSDRADENVQEASDLADKMLKLERERFDREEP